MPDTPDKGWFLDQRLREAKAMSFLEIYAIFGVPLMFLLLTFAVERMVDAGARADSSNDR